MSDISPEEEPLESLQDVAKTLSVMIKDPQLQGLCDVVLAVDGQKFRGHKAVLAGASPVFRAMFTNGMKESASPQYPHEVELEQIDPQAVKLALDFIYSGRVALKDEETALLVLSFAHMYQLESLVGLIEVFLASRVRLDNCVELWRYGMHYSLDKMKQACLNILGTSFEDLAFSMPLLEFPRELVTELLRSDKLAIKSELTVLEAIVRWIQANEDERKSDLDLMLSLVRVSHMSSLELTEAGRNPLAFSSVNFRTTLLTAFLEQGSPDMKTEWAALNNHLSLRERAKSFRFTHRIPKSLFKHSERGLNDVSRWFVAPSGKYMCRLEIERPSHSSMIGAYLRFKDAYDVVGSNHPLVKYDIFLVNKKNASKTVCRQKFERRLSFSQRTGLDYFTTVGSLIEEHQGFIDDETESCLFGATIEFVAREVKSPRRFFLHRTPKDNKF